MGKIYKYTCQVIDRSHGNRIESGTVEASHVRIAAGRAIRGASAGATVRLEIATCTASETNAARDQEAAQHRQARKTRAGCWHANNEHGNEIAAEGGQRDRGCVFCGGAKTAAQASRRHQEARRMGWTTGAASWAEVVRLFEGIEAGTIGAGGVLALAGWVPGAPLQAGQKGGA